LIPVSGFLAEGRLRFDHSIWLEPKELRGVSQVQGLHFYRLNFAVEHLAASQESREREAEVFPFTAWSPIALYPGMRTRPMRLRNRKTMR